MKRAAFLVLLTAVALGCKKRDITEHKWYVDPSHVRFFGEWRDWYDGGGVTFDGEGNYIASGGLFYRNDGAEEALDGVVVSYTPDGNLNWFIKYTDEDSPFQNIVPITPNEFLAVSEWKRFLRINSSGEILDRIAVDVTVGYMKHSITVKDGYIYYAGAVAFDTLPEGSNGRLCVDKYDLSGSMVWRKCYMDVPVKAYTTCAILSDDDGVIAEVGLDGSFIGYENMGYLMMKVDTSGNMVWVTREVKPKEWAIWEEHPPVWTSLCFNKMIRAHDGGIVGVMATLLVKTDSTGHAKWIRSVYNYNGRMWNGFFYGVTKTPDGFYAAAGLGNNCPATGCVLFAKFDDGGNILNIRHYFWGPSQGATDIEATPDGYLLMVGDGEAPNPDSTGEYVYDRIALFLFKVDKDGNPVW